MKVISDEDARYEMVLIPDEVDYEEHFIDHYLRWLADDDPNDSKKKRFMVDADAEIKYFERRKEDLISQVDLLIGGLDDQKDNQIEEMKSDHRQKIGSGKTADDLAQFEGNTESAYEKRKGRIARRFKELRDQCDERIMKAKKVLKNGKEFPEIESSDD
jgi:hypothetical protein